jgi:hypothetical protein
MSQDEKPKRPTGPISSSNRTIVAFPFSTVRTEETSAEVRELALIVSQLAETVAKLDPSLDNDELLQKVRALVNKLT